MKLVMPSSPCSDSQANTNHFFKIILSDADSQTKLMIPTKFVKNYGTNLDSRIILNAPNGLAWPVNLERHEGDVWLHDGWPEFARFYSIQFGYLLVFKYREHCDFKVRVFDPSSTEIEYPSCRSAKLNSGESRQARKRPIEIDDSTSSDSTSSDLIRPRKRRVGKLPSKDGVCLTPKLQQEKKILGARRSATKEAEARALASAEAFKSDNPFFFHVMRRTYVDGRGCGLVVKKSFEESYKKWNNNDKVYLQVAGKSWTVNCDMKCNVCRLRSGWDRFAKDNSLTAGDVCVFQLIDASKKILEVVIFRATKETHGDGGSATEESKSKVLHFASAEDFKSQNPFFALALKESYVDGKGRGMVVRKAFEKTYQMWKNDDQVILQFEGKTWPVYCDINRNGCSLRRGWDRFVRDNLLTVGDACVFEPIASEKLLQVFIFRAAKETNSKENNVPRRVKIEAKEARVLTSDNAFTSTYPFFRVKVYPSSLSGPNLSLPKIFVKRYITMDSCMVTLQISDGREWLVKCTYYKSRPKFSVGWNIFAQANHLAAGDICTFKLIDFSTKLLQVFISRAAKETKRKEDKILPKKSEAREARVLSSVSSFTSKYSFFTVKVYPSSLSGGALSVPSKFIKNHITKDSCDVTLQTSNGKLWLVKCIVYNNGTKFSGGWNRFARANQLAAGDVCAFELINFSEKLLNVIIFRN